MGCLMQGVSGVSMIFNGYKLRRIGLEKKAFPFTIRLLFVSIPLCETAVNVERETLTACIGEWPGSVGHIFAPQ